MAEVIWTEPALQELDALAEYIALGNPFAAGHPTQEIFDKTGRLEDFPLFFYRGDEKRVLVLYAMREERQLRR